MSKKEATNMSKNVCKRCEVDTFLDGGCLGFVAQEWRKNVCLNCFHPSQEHHAKLQEESRSSSCTSCGGNLIFVSDKKEQCESCGAKFKARALSVEFDNSSSTKKTESEEKEESRGEVSSETLEARTEEFPRRSETVSSGQEKISLKKRWVSSSLVSSKEKAEKISSTVNSWLGDSFSEKKSEMYKGKSLTFKLGTRKKAESRKSLNSPNAIPRAAEGVSSELSSANSFFELMNSSYEESNFVLDTFSPNTITLAPKSPVEMKRMIAERNKIAEQLVSTISKQHSELEALSQVHFDSYLRKLFFFFTKSKNKDLKKILTQFIPEALKQLFKNAAAIEQFLHVMLKDLNATLEKATESHSPEFGGIFNQLADFVRMYSPYVADHSKAMSLIETEISSNSELRAALRDVEREKGIQLLNRVPSHPTEILNGLESFLYATSTEDRDYEKLKTSWLKMNLSVEKIRRRKMESENIETVWFIAKRIRGLNELTEPHRRFVVEGDFKVSIISKEDTSSAWKILTETASHRVFLFNDWIVFCEKISSELFKFKILCRLQDTSVSKKNEDPNLLVLETVLHDNFSSRKKKKKDGSCKVTLQLQCEDGSKAIGDWKHCIQAKTLPFFYYLEFISKVNFA